MSAELCKWLRENSSGAYRKSAEAADLIERLEAELAELKAAHSAEASGGDGRALVVAGLHGLVNHVRAVPDYSRLLGDMDVVDKAIALLAASHIKAGGQGGEDGERWRAVERADNELTLRLHNSRPDQRAKIIDAARATLAKANDVEGV